MAYLKRSPHVRKRRLAIAAGDNAAADLRASLKRAGEGTCAACGITYLASALDVDHVLPLHKGGKDTADNVQVLCREVCHKAKTRRDCGYQKVPF